MRLPVIYTTNYQIQDADGVIVADLFKNPKAEEDGVEIVKILNGVKGFMRAGMAPVGVLISSNGGEVAPAVILSRSDRMKLNWAKRKAKVKV